MSYIEFSDHIEYIYDAKGNVDICETHKKYCDALANNAFGFDDYEFKEFSIFRYNQLFICLMEYKGCLSTIKNMTKTEYI